MFRARRYRVFLIFAIFVLAGLYHFSDVRQWERTSATGPEALRKSGPKNKVQVDAQKDAARPAEPQKTWNPPPVLKTDAPSSSPQASKDDDSKPANTRTTERKALEEPMSTASTQLTMTISASDFQRYAQTTSSAPPMATNPTTETSQQDQRYGSLHETEEKIHWTRMPEHFPVPTESIIPIPTGKAKSMPKIQHDFKDESSDLKIDRERKLAIIKEAFEHSWTGYKSHAWMHDELRPISGTVNNPFNGWGATLVDTLDTLWIMGMKQEFEEAVIAVAGIDFTTSTRRDIPLFETTIRYLGGLVAAYDISDHKYRVLLDKAVELAEILMGVFDTPNRMPIPYYNWRPAFASQPHRAPTHIVLAELGSLSLEFTRLAQITKEAKYYDAIARITNELEIWQNNTKLPGLWPKSVDASGCKKPDTSSVRPIELPKQNLPAVEEPLVEPAVVSEPTLMDPPAKVGNSLVAKRQLSMDSPVSNHTQIKDAIKETSKESKPQIPLMPDKPECEPQGLTSPPHTNSDTFSIGGEADSVYEYLPKMYMLIGGLTDQYQKMHEAVIAAINEHSLFRAMIPDNDREILVIGSVMAFSDLDYTAEEKYKLIPDQQHLLCFVGGMYAVGAQIFSRAEDLKLASKLTDACVWAYESTPSGIMPEGFSHVACKSRDDCRWNEARWHDELFPYGVKFEQQAAARYFERRTLANPVQDSMGIVENQRTAGRKGKRQVEGAEKTLPGDAATDAAGASENLVEATGHDPLPDASTEKFNSNIQDDADNTSTMELMAQLTSSSVVPTYTPPPPPTKEELIQAKVESERLPPGITKMSSKSYILRPEAIESVFIMYRVTGNEYWREKGWEMFTSIEKVTRAEYGHSAIYDVTEKKPNGKDSMESFWLAETLKYFYLLFSEPDLVSLDDWVLNTEAHPFKRPK